MHDCFTGQVLDSSHTNVLQAPTVITNANDDLKQSYIGKIVKKEKALLSSHIDTESVTVYFSTFLRL